MNLNTTNPHHYHLATEKLNIEVLGGVRVDKLDTMRCTLKLTHKETHQSIRQGLDLYSSSYVTAFIRRAATKLGAGIEHLEQSLDVLTDELEKYKLEENTKDTEELKERKLSKEEQLRAMNYGKKKGLHLRLQEDLGQAGIVGEDTNRIILLYLLATHITHNPLHAIVQGSSGSGKTHLLNSVVDLMPKTRVLNATDLSSKVLYYFREDELKNKILHFEDLDGVESSLLPLRELASKAEISRYVVVKDKNGRSRSMKQKTQGPVSIAGTTTQETVYEDNANRSFLLEVDSSKTQDKKILDYQRMKESGLVRKDQEREAQRKLQDLILTLKNVTIKNPYAIELTLPDKVFKPRRANMHYLNFIRAVTLMHQWQREKQVDEQTGEEYIEVSLEDIGIANELMKEVLLKKSDELSGACRVFFERIKQELQKEDPEKDDTEKGDKSEESKKEESTFSSQEIRTALRLHPSQFSRYMKQLKERGYIQQVKGKGKGSTYRYKVVIWDDYQLLKAGVAKMDEVLKELEKRAK
jgi:hypothetical protein